MLPGYSRIKYLKKWAVPGILALVATVVLTLNSIDHEVHSRSPQRLLQHNLAAWLAWPVTFKELEQGPEAMQFRVRDLLVPNPPKYRFPFALRIPQLTYSRAASTGHAVDVVIDELNVPGVEVVVEQKGLTTNINVLLDAVKTRHPSAEAGDQQRFIIRSAIINITNARLVTEHHGNFDLSLAPVHFHNLGVSNSGLTRTELIEAMWVPLLTQIKQAAKAKFLEVAATQAGP